MIDNIRSVAILGASGTIGSLIGGLFAQCGLHVHYISRTLEGTKRGLARAIKAARSEVISRHIECWNYEHGIEPALSAADLIIESVSEVREIKQHLYHLVERYRRPGVIVGTTTSSLPLSALIEGRSDDFQRHFLSTHFYNPPGRMLACEIASTQATDPGVQEFMHSFLEQKLRRVVIPVKNSVAFAGNRIAFVFFDKMTHLAERCGVEMTDYLIGPYTGRLMPPLATLDLVGLDVHRAIIHSLRENTRDGGNGLAVPRYMEEMISRGLLGDKSGSGFYKTAENGRQTFVDPQSLEYVAPIEPHIRFVEKAKQFIHVGMYREAVDVIRTAEGPEADVVKDTLAQYLSHAFSLIGEVTDRDYGIHGIDRVMASGFNWAPPSVLVRMLGGREKAADFVCERKLEVPHSLQNGDTFTNWEPDAGRYFIAQ